jgi:hypothetical protein
MRPLYWFVLTLLALTSLSSAIFYVLYLGSNEPVPLARAKALYRWSVVIVLGSFNWYVYGLVIEGIRAIPR